MHASSSSFSASIDILLIFYLLYFTRHISFLGGGGHTIMMKSRVKCTDVIINRNLLQIFSCVGFKKIASHLKI